MANASVNVVVVGDDHTSKTSLLLAIKGDSLSEHDTPYVLGLCTVNIVIDGIEVDLGLWDTKGYEDYDRLRPLIYPFKDAILMCFSIVSPKTFQNITENRTWIDGLKYHCLKVPIILVGNKKDLRNDPTIINDLSKLDLKPVTTEEGYALAQKIEAYTYLECSAKTGEGVHEVFEAATRAGLQFKKNKKKKKCCLL